MVEQDLESQLNVPENPMRRALCYALAGAALLGVGTGIGILVQREMQIAGIDATEELARDLTGLNAPPLPAPAWQHWTYPGADAKTSGKGGGIRIGGEIVMPTDHHGVWTTGDSFEDVIRHYATLLEFEDPEKYVERDAGFGGGISRRVSSEYGPATNAHFRDNGRDSAIDSRPVRVECLTRRCRSYSVADFISRADDEELTHVIVLYSPGGGASYEEE